MVPTAWPEKLTNEGLVASCDPRQQKPRCTHPCPQADFKDGSVRVLVATDIAARGIDIQQLPHVVNLDLPNVAEDYVHRIGRTGRAGECGHAISLVAAEEALLLKAIERTTRESLEKVLVPGFEPTVLDAPPSISVEAVVDAPPRGRADPKSSRTQSWWGGRVTGWILALCIRSSQALGTPPQR